MIDGKTQVLGVIGCPIEHTMSPAIHNMLAQRLGQNLVYVPFHVERECLEDAIKGALALEIKGLNVTVPHKSEVINYLEEVDELAKKIGAVNTLVPCDGGYKGYNTDMPGLLRAMHSDGVELNGREVILLGAGGVARAVALMLAENDVKKIRIYNRTLSKAEDIRQEVNRLEGRDIVEAYSLQQIYELPEGAKYLVIQTTNVGMYPNVNAAAVEEEAFYDKVEIGYDLIYNPLETRFMSLVKQHGGRAYNGLRMLVYQGIIAYELWNELSVSDQLADEIYTAVLKLL